MNHKKKKDHIHMGKFYLGLGDLNNALLEFKLAKVNPPKDELIKCGDLCLKRERTNDALKAFELAEDKDKLIECGDFCFKRGWLTNSRKAYRSAALL